MKACYAIYCRQKIAIKHSHDSSTFNRYDTESFKTNLQYVHEESGCSEQLLTCLASATTACNHWVPFASVEEAKCQNKQNVLSCVAPPT